MSFLFTITLIFTSCGKQLQEVQKGAEDDRAKVQVVFFNESSFKVDIYRNVNPSHLDALTPPIATVLAGGIAKVSLPPSDNQIVGDVFYIRYYVQLADSFASGTGKPLYVQAKRDISNISFVLKEGTSYTKKIVQPMKGTLTFINRYIKVQNTGDAVLQVINGDTYLKKLGSQELNLTSGKFGFYEFSIPLQEKNINLKSLMFFVPSAGRILHVSDFILERGKIYSFQCNGKDIIGPNIENMTY